MQLENGKLTLNNHNLESILTHIVLCAECEIAIGGDVTKMDLIEMFNEELGNQKWLNDLENYEHSRIEINI